MIADAPWRPRHDDPLFILAMDHRGSFGQTLFDVEGDQPTPEQRSAMVAAKQLIYRGLAPDQRRIQLARLAEVSASLRGLDTSG